MRIFYFDTETGIFQGEGYEEEKHVGSLEGVTSIPPLPCGKGQVPVYDFRLRRWQIREVFDERTKVNHGAVQSGPRS